MQTEHSDPVHVHFAAAYCRTSLYYPESKTSVQFSLLISIYAGFLLLWENIVPMRFGCRGNRFEIFANLFPVGLLLMAVFSQYHPVTAVILLCVPAMLTAVFGIFCAEANARAAPPTTRSGTIYVP